MPHLLKILVLGTLAIILPLVAAAAAEKSARTALVGFSEAPDTLTVYFSLSCPHCLTSIEKTHKKVREMVRAKMLKLELVEIPGAIGQPPGAAYAGEEEKLRAIRNGYQASLAYACAGLLEPEEAWRRLQTFYVALRKTIDPALFDYTNWAFAKPDHLTETATKPWPDPASTQSGRMIAAYYVTRMQVGWPPHLEMRRCVSDADERRRILDRLNARSARFKATGYRGVPVYLLNGKRISRSEFERIMSRKSE